MTKRKHHNAAFPHQPGNPWHCPMALFFVKMHPDRSQHDQIEGFTAFGNASQIR